MSVHFNQIVWNHIILAGQRGVPGPRGPPGVPGEKGTVALKGRLTVLSMLLFSVEFQADNGSNVVISRKETESEDRNDKNFQKYNTGILFVVAVQ